MPIQRISNTNTAQHALQTPTAQNSQLKLSVTGLLLTFSWVLFICFALCFFFVWLVCFVLIDVHVSFLLSGSTAWHGSFIGCTDSIRQKHLIMY